MAIRRLLSFAAPKLRYIAQTFGYVAGTLAAMDATLEDFAPDEAGMLRKYGLLTAWETCFAALVELNDRRPRWESIREIGMLFPSCHAIFSALGLHYRLQGINIWVDVPETPETPETLP